MSDASDAELHEVHVQFGATVAAGVLPDTSVAGVTVIFAPNLSGMAVVGDGGEEALQALRETVLEKTCAEEGSDDDAEGEGEEETEENKKKEAEATEDNKFKLQLLDVFSPILVPNAGDARVAAMLAKDVPIPGRRVHQYDWSGKNFEVYAGTTSACAYVAERMQPILAGMGPQGQSVDTLCGDETVCLFTVCRPDASPDRWEMVGYVSADEVPCWPLTKTALYIEGFCTLPQWQRNGHGTVLLACLWQYAADTGFQKVLWNEYKGEALDGPAGEGEAHDDDGGFSFEHFARAMHLARMISLKIFRKYIPGHNVNGDAFSGDPSGKSLWEKIREAKAAAYAKPPMDLPNKLIWTRRAAEQASKLLLLPVCTVRELFEIQLLKASSEDRANMQPKAFVKRRLFEMDKTNFRSVRDEDIFYHLDRNYRETYEQWRADMAKAMRLRQSGMLPTFSVPAELAS